ncbi:MAG: SpoIID/LytB domain-containing protein, partial [Ilumatobacteraceae bacterium]
MRWKSLAALAVAGMGVTIASGIIPRPSVAVAAPAAVAGITLVGHGNGHGIGLSQWGAYGYAVDQGWDAWAIVDHYYGGTVHGTAPLDATVTVRLQGLDGAQTAVVAHTADITATAPAGTVVVAPPGTRAMVARFVPGTGYSVWASTVESCPAASDPLPGWTPVATGLANVTFATASANQADFDQLVSTCRPYGTVRTYRGTIQAVTGTAAEIRTVNAVPVEQYLRAVVAKEMSPSWAVVGGGRGMAALQAQVIAGRSYALSEKLSSYAMTCDSLCQTYQGAATRTSLAAAQYVAVENTLSDPAVTSTAG